MLTLSNQMKLIPLISIAVKHLVARHSSLALSFIDSFGGQTFLLFLLFPRNKLSSTFSRFGIGNHCNDDDDGDDGGEDGCV